MKKKNSAAVKIVMNYSISTEIKLSNNETTKKKYTLNFSRLYASLGYCNCN